LQTINITNLKKLLALISCFVFFSCYANSIDKYNVKDIYIELELNKDEEYREKALNSAYKIALLRYLNWITLEKKDEIAKILDSISVKDFVSGYSIESESFKKNKYSALISVNFEKKKVTELLDKKSIKYSLQEGPKTLILPIMNLNSKLILWDDPNPWFEAWLSRPLDPNLNQFILPSGEVDDLITLSAIDAKNLQYYKLKNISVKYGAKKILVLIVNILKKQNNYILDLKVFNGLEQKEVFLEQFNFLSSGDLNKDLIKLANEFSNYYDDLWVTKNIDKNSLKSDWLVEIRYNKFSQWIKVKNRLLNSDKVTNLAVSKLSNNRAFIDINIISEELFLEELIDKEYIIEKNNNTLKIIYKN
jgi:hypothetical protein